jgi:hypothetical protein
MEQSSLFGAILNGAFIYAYWAAWGATNIACAYFVYQSAIRRTRAELGIGPYWWALLTLIGGVWTLLIYWLIEHSTLSSHRNDDAP